MRRLLGITAALGLASCGQLDEEPSHLYWSRDLLELAQLGDPLPGLGPVDDMVVLRGKPLPPDATGAQPLQDPGQDGLVVDASFVEGQPAAYITSEVWYAFSPVWAQSLYVPVTSYDPAAPFAHAIAGSFVFAVGPETPFYSPFWKTFFVEVPAGTPAGRYKSEKAILDAKLPMHEGGLQLCLFLPGGDEVMGIAAPAGGGPTRPFNGVPATPSIPGPAYAEGNPVTVLGLGMDRFATLAGDVVEADALFHWVTRDAKGQLQEAMLPSVGGTGPLGTRRAPSFTTRTSRGKTGPSPHFGSLWRLYQAELPAGAAAFVLPDVFKTSAAAWKAQGVPLPGDPGVPAVAPAIAARPDVNDYVGRVALSPACFGDAARFPAQCQFLDSQAAVESTLPAATLHETETVVTCPLVVFQNQTVPAP
jgi:hypothetical protein